MLFRLDDYLFHLLYAGAPGARRTTAVVLSLVGGGWGMLGILPLLLRKDARRFAAWLTCTLVGTATLVFLLKNAVGRGRPYTVYAGLHDALAASPTDFSFPSGHAAGAFAFAAFVTSILLGRDPRPTYAVSGSVAALVFAVAVALSRVVLGFHFPLDVAAGSLLGGSIGAVSGARFSRAPARES